MKRRNFIRNSSISAVGLPGALNGFNLTAHADDGILGQFFPPGTYNDHILVVTLHHIASDGWSRSILVNDFTALYKAAEAGTSANLPQLPVQYADFATWQRKHLQGSIFEEKLTYWKNRLQGVPRYNSQLIFRDLLCRGHKGQFIVSRFGRN